MQAIQVLKVGIEATAGAADTELARQIKVLARKLRDQGRGSSAGGGKDAAVAAAGVVSENGGKVGY